MPHSLDSRKALRSLFLSPAFQTWSFWLRDKLLPVFFPGRCPFCGNLLPWGSLVCQTCRTSLPLVRDPVCYRCGKPVASPEQEYCYDCLRFPKSFDGGIALFIYNEKTRPVMVDFKYHNRRTLSRYFAQEIFDRYRSVLRTWAPGLILPVPIHRNRRKKRGYNQAALLARDLSVLMGLPFCPDLLLRTTDTTPQKQLTPQARLNNLQDAFRFNEEAFRQLFDKKQKGPNPSTPLLLVDDIYTTGATLESCSRILTARGFQRIYVCTVCIGVSRDSIKGTVPLIDQGDRPPDRKKDFSCYYIV